MTRTDAVRDQLSISGWGVDTKRAIRLKDLSRPCRVALALSLFLHGCGGESGGSTAAVYDSAGVRIVENRDVEGNRTSSWTVSPEATLHLGGTSATKEAELFSELTGVTRLVGGEVVVLEGSLSELRFFGEDGEHIRTIGGKGEGPGEFGRAVSFIRLAGDSLLVRDNRKSSLVLFAPGGKYVRSEPVDRRQLWGLLDFMAVGSEPALPDHSLLEFVLTEEPSPVPEGASRPTESYPNTLLVRVSADLLTVDTLGPSRLRHAHFVELPVRPRPAFYCLVAATNREANRAARESAKMSRSMLHESTCPVGIALAALALAGGPATAQDTVELPLEDRVLTADFPEVYRIGDGVRDWELLTRVTSIGFDAQGNLHIGDWSGGDLSVLVVDSSGNLVVRFGRPGEGPGDFRDATHAFALPDGRTVVADDGHLAYQLFDARGVLERWVRYPGVSEGETPGGWFVRSADPRVRKVDRWDGSMLARVTVARRLQVDSIAREFDMQAGSGPRTVLRVHLDGDEASESEVARASRPDVEEEFHFAALPGGRVAYSDTTAYLIKVTDPAGNVDRVLVRSFTPRHWTDRTARAFREYLGTSIDEAIAGGGGRARLIGSFGGPSFFQQRADDWEPEGAIPHVAGLETTWDGNIWVLRTPARGFIDVDHVGVFLTALQSTPTGLTAAGPGPIDVITPEGEYLGTVPNSRLPNAFGPDRLAAYVQLDELGVPTVVVRRVPEGIR